MSCNTLAEARTPGPHIVAIDYEELYAMPSPPAYTPFEVYGLFLFSVAAQETPLVMNPATPVPNSVRQEKHVVFKTGEDGDSL